MTTGKMKIKGWRWKLVEKLTLLATEMSSWILKDRGWNYQLKDFGRMPKNSLGKRFYDYMVRNKIGYKPNLIQHDMKHILLGYEMKMPDEMHLHTYLMGNRSWNMLGMAYLAVCLAIVPEYLPKLRSDYRRGKLSQRLSSIDFRPMLCMDLIECRNQLNIRL